MPKMTDAAFTAWREHVRKCRKCAAGMPTPETVDRNRLCKEGAKLRAAWKEQK